MIRRATPADADALSALARECFTQTFEHLYAPGDLAIFLDQAYSPAILRSELQDPQRATWLLFEDAVGGPSSPDEASCTPSDLVSSPGPTVHTPGEHPSIPYSGEEAPASFPDGLIGYVTACPTPTSHPATARSSASTSCADTRVGATGPRCCAPRLSGSNATGRAPSGSACGAKTTGTTLLRAPRLRDRRRVLLHGRRPRRPRVHHPPPGERLTPTVLRLRGDNLQMLMPPGKTGGLAGRKEMR